MKSSTYYFDETGRQKNNLERESISFDSSQKKKSQNIHKLQSKSYLNIFFYAWFIICIVFIISYILLYNYSQKRHNKNKIIFQKNETVITKENKEHILPKDNKNRPIIHKNETVIIKEDNEHIISKENKIRTIIQNNETIIKKENNMHILPIEKNRTISEKIGIAFVFRERLLNDIEIMLFLLANKLIKFDKYDIYLITHKDLNLDLEIDQKIKIIKNISNETSLRNFDKKENIKFYILNNEFSYYSIKLYKTLNGGKKIIGIMPNSYFSYIYTNSTIVYSKIHNIHLYDAFINIIPDEYYIYEKLGIKNTFYIPQLYTFLPQNTPNSKLININILMIGREKELLKGGIYGIKAMSIIVKSIPNAKLYIISSNHNLDFLRELIRQLHLQNNIEILHNVNKTQYYLNSSLLLYPSISESYSYIMNEAKSHAIPIIAFNLSYNPSYHKGVILVDNLNYNQMANEAIRLLNNFEYRKIKGLEAKLSLYEYILNNEIIERFKKIFNLLLEKNNTEEYKKFQNNTYKGYYFHNLSKERLILDYRHCQKFNVFFQCHSFNDMMRMNYIDNIKECKDLFSSNRHI